MGVALTFQASSKSTGKMTYRFFLTATRGQLDACTDESDIETCLVDRLLDRWMQSRLNSIDPVERRLCGVSECACQVEIWNTYSPLDQRQDQGSWAQ